MRATLTLECCATPFTPLTPALFAALLGHWMARKIGLPFRMPRAHTFNPLRVLQLACTLDGDHAVVEALFHFVWGSSGNLDDDAAFAKIETHFGVTDLAAAINQDS